MRLRSVMAVAVGAVAATTGLANPAKAGSATATPAPTRHQVSAQRAQELMAAAQARGTPSRGGTQALVQSAGSAIPDASGSRAIPNGCRGSWFVTGGRGAANANAETIVTCPRQESEYARATLFRKRAFGWSAVAPANSSLSTGAFHVAVAFTSWRCKGVGTYTYKNSWIALTRNGGFSGTIQSRFPC